MDDIAIYRINAGDGDGAEVIFDYNDKRISVSVFPSIPPQRDNLPDKHGYFAEDRLIDLLDRAVSVEIDDEYEEITDEALIIILDAGKSLFAELKSHPLVQPTQDLHSILYSESLFFRLLTTSGKTSLIPIDSKEAYTCPEEISNSNFGSDLNTNNDGLPRYSPKDILVEEVFVQGAAHAVCRVLVGSKVMLCKAWKTGLSNLNLERELAKLQKVREADLHMRLNAPARVPRLLGYVMHPTLDWVLGLLREWIPGRCLRGIDIPSTVEGRRRKWASQICETVNQLHKISVIWGDGKAGNIIIDTEDDAWLIDFGGGWTEGWVDEELADTVEGDEQAAKRIMQFMDIQ